MNDPNSTSNTRRLRLRMRPDLVVAQQRFDGRRHWALKDPVSLTYTKLCDEEYAILQMLDGRTGMAEIKRRFEEMFAPLQLSLGRLQAFLGRAHRHGLVVGDAPGQAEQLLLRRGTRLRRQAALSFSRVLAIRFRGFDPEPLLTWLYPKCRWMFSSVALAMASATVLAAIVVCCVRWGAIQTRLPEYEAFFAAGNIVPLLVALAGVKVLHELGHAMACKHFGGECHEMGLMLLLFTPCLYSNVSDSWMLPSKWHRIAIAAAGIMVEVVLAAICAFLWLFSEPGLLNSLCLAVMFVCSVSTILINGNPLLRYDGYYILADLLEIPNLAERSRRFVHRKLARLCLGVTLEGGRAVPERRTWTLAGYWLASTIYRTIVLVAVLWFLHHWLTPYGLGSLVAMAALLVIATTLFLPLAMAAQTLRSPAVRAQVRRGRVVASLVLFALMAAGVWMIPVPHRVSAPVVVEATNAQNVFVSTAGTLIEAVKPSTPVRPGDRLALLDDAARRDVARLEGERDHAALQLANLQSRRVLDSEAAAEVPAAAERLADLRDRLAQRESDLARLEITSPAAGVVLPPPRTPSSDSTAGQLSTWHGTPLDSHNRGCHLEIGTLLCSVGDPAQLEATLAIDQSDLAFVREGSPVLIQLDELPGQTLEGTISEIARRDLEHDPRAPDADTRQRPPLETHYTARVTFDDGSPPVLVGAVGRAKVIADSQPLGKRIARYLSRTFNFEL